MLSIRHNGSSCYDELTRREWLRVGGIGLGGLTLAHLLRQPAQAAPRPNGGGRARSVIIFGLLGGPPQHETWDPKPDAPAEVRGPFGSIPTSVPGLRVGELMPRTAALCHKLCVVRSVVTNNPSHVTGSYELRTGTEHPGAKLNDSALTSRTDFPYFGSVVKRFRRPLPGVPTAVVFPQKVFNLAYMPGQDGGFLGGEWDPWHVLADPAAADFRLDDLALPAEVPF